MKIRPFNVKTDVCLRYNRICVYCVPTLCELRTASSHPAEYCVQLYHVKFVSNLSVKIHDVPWNVSLYIVRRTSLYYYSQKINDNFATKHTESTRIVVIQPDSVILVLI